jgi:tetratricopeptide (TPR) repeat protein
VRTEPGLDVEIRAGNRRLNAMGKEESGGSIYRLSLPQEDSRLTVRLLRADGTQGPPWSLALRRAEIPTWLTEVSSLQAEEMVRRLERLRKEAPRSEQGLVLGMLAGLAWREGDEQAYVRYLEQGIAADRAEGCLSCEVGKTTQLAGYYLDHGHFIQARQMLDALHLPAQAPGDAKCLMAYYRGLLGDAVGDYRSALEQLRQADDLAKRLEMRKYRWDVEQVLARVLQDLGRSAEASELFGALRSDPKPAGRCDLGSLLTNMSWARLLAREAGEPSEDPAPDLEQALGEFERNPCPPDKRLNAHLNLALAHQQAGRWAEARRELEQARQTGASPNLAERLWWNDLEARSAIAEGRPQYALELYEQLAKEADLALSPDGRLRAALGLAKARLSLGQRTEALDALADADRQIDEQSGRIPAHEGRDTFVAQREAVTRLYLDLLLENGRIERAFEVARRARSRLLRQLTVRDRLTQLTAPERQKWERSLSEYRVLREDLDRQADEEWKLPVDQRQRARGERAAQLATAQNALDHALASLGDPGEGTLSPPGPGEVILAYHPVRKGWVGFAATERGIEVSPRFDLYKLTLLNHGELARLLLSPFRQTLRSVERVRVLAYGDLRKVDFHSLMFGSEPLLARHLVVYSLDLPVRSSPATAGASARPVALVVADPPSDLGDLPAARQEGREVADAIGRWGSGWSCERWEGERARADKVRGELPKVSLFHYAGHGVFAGFSGWDSSLPLADGHLTLGDVLALRRAPDWVVLSACEGGRSSQEAPGEGIGLANAFLLAGSRAVIASNQPVADTGTQDLMRELYRGWRPGEDLPHQLQRAQFARFRQGSSTAVWGAFRLLVP